MAFNHVFTFLSKNKNYRKSGLFKKIFLDCRQDFSVLFIIFITVITACTSDVRFDKDLLQQNPNGRPLESFEAIGRNVMVVTSHPIATQIGYEVLKNEGNAIDASVAVSFALSVLFPQSAGIGAGGTVLLHSGRDKETLFFDFRGITLLKTHQAALHQGNGVGIHLIKNNSLPASTISMPGLVAGQAFIHQKYGVIPWNRLLQPAIYLASNGINVYPNLAKAIVQRQKVIQKNPHMAKLFFKNGNALPDGEALVQADLANTLQIIARSGGDAFYKGRVIAAIADEIAKLGVTNTPIELNLNQVKIHKPSESVYGGYKVISPLNIGGYINPVLNAFEFFNLSQLKFKSQRHLYLLVEGLKQADVDQKRLLWRSDFDNISLIREEEIAACSIIVDAAGNVILSAQMSTDLFGSGIMVPGTGIILNGMSANFLENKVNIAVQKKTFLNELSAVIVFKKDRPVLVVGGAGGSKGLTAVLQTISNVIDFNIPMLTAVSQKRIHRQPHLNQLFLEKGAVPEKTQQGLISMGYDPTIKEAIFGDVQAIYLQEDGSIIGVADPRGNGKALGY